MSAMPLAAPSDADPQETREWLDALQAVIAEEGPERAHFLLEQLIALSHQAGINMPYSATTDYINTIPVDQQPVAPGDYEMEHRIRTYARWNALAMVLRANKGDSNLGGHIASYASAATLYDVGFNHFWRSPLQENHGGDLVFSQGHSAPGIYARAFMLGRLTEEQMDNFRAEVDGKGLLVLSASLADAGLLAVPDGIDGPRPAAGDLPGALHEVPADRDLIATGDRKVWAFMGDGEMDEPESMGAIGMAGREKLDNLVFVINCNLQRLDGPVRGNGKIIQELEADFRGAGWNVIKVIWGSYWDALLGAGQDGPAAKRMMECIDGDYQTFKAKDGAYVREHFFNTPELKAMVATGRTTTSGASIAAATTRTRSTPPIMPRVDHAGSADGNPRQDHQGLRHGRAGEAQNITHQQKKMGTTSLKAFRDRFKPAAQGRAGRKAGVHQVPRGIARTQYMRERRMALGGYLPARRPRPSAAGAAAVRLRAAAKAGGEGREFSTTMAFVRMPQHPAQGQGDRQARGADRGRRVAHFRHGGHVPPDRHLESGAELRAAGPRTS
jgi:pyruvate dehydrogenase E1 component